jgi:hypothetical protein
MNILRMKLFLWDLLAGFSRFLTEFPLSGSSSKPQLQWSSPPPHTKHTAPLFSIQPNFFGQRRDNLNLNVLDKTDTLNPNSKFNVPIMGGRTILPMLLHQYGCGQDIATNIFPPIEDSPCL